MSEREEALVMLQESLVSVNDLALQVRDLQRENALLNDTIQGEAVAL